MPTKAEERKALAQIRDIINALGEDSYIGIALAGCLDDAETNIENDFALSMKDRYESALEKAHTWRKCAKEWKELADKRAAKIQRLEREAAALDNTLARVKSVLGGVN